MANKFGVPRLVPIPHPLFQIIIAMPEVHPEMRSLGLKVHGCMLTLLIIIIIIQQFPVFYIFNMSLTHFLYMDIFNSAIKFFLTTYTNSTLILCANNMTNVQ